MTQYYSDPAREHDAYALPDLEVFWADDIQRYDEPEFLPAGWYYWFCFRGCLPEGEANGPFTSEAEALADARSWND